MISAFKEIEGLFTEIDTAIMRTEELFVIGGAVLLFHGLKTATKDIDLVVETKAEFLALEKALHDLGFSGNVPGREYKTGCPDRNDGVRVIGLFCAGSNARKPGWTDQQPGVFCASTAR